MALSPPVSVPAAPVVVAPAGRRRDRPRVPELLSERIRPLVLSRAELLPTAAPFAELLGTPGLRRGSTLVVASTGANGATSIALGLVARASAAGAWCAAVGMEDLGCVAASELGLTLDRLVLVPRPARRAAAVIAALLDGCDVVLVAAGLSMPDRRRLSARARERRSVLVELVGTKAATAVVSEGRFDGADVRFTVTKSAFSGLGQGAGRLRDHRIDVVATRRSASPRELSASLWFAPPGGMHDTIEVSLEETIEEQPRKVSAR